MNQHNNKVLKITTTEHYKLNKDMLQGCGWNIPNITDKMVAQAHS